MNMNDVLKEQLDLISLSDREIQELRDVSSGIVARLEDAGFTAFVGGSLAKGTLVRKEIQDIDIFVVFDSEPGASSFSQKVQKIDFEYDVRIVHGSRDYVQLILEDSVIELIPTVQVEKPENAMNVTDVSLFHVDYVREHIRKNPKIADEIRLAKVFCQAQNVYGAESYVRGFSGYSLEVLVIHFGSFLNFLKEVSRKKVVDPAKHFKDERAVMYELNAAKLASPLIVVDPTYKLRNVTAGLGNETYGKFLNVAKEFLKHPSPDFFTKKELDVSELQNFADKKAATLFVLEIESDRQEGDIVGTKCLKFLDFFSDELERNNQEVVRKEFVYSGTGKVATGYVAIKESEVMIVKGPPVSMKEAAKKFQKEHKNAFEKKGQLFFEKKMSVYDIFTAANRVKDEMGVFGKSLEKL